MTLYIRCTLLSAPRSDMNEQLPPNPFPSAAPTNSSFEKRRERVREDRRACVFQCRTLRTPLRLGDGRFCVFGVAHVLHFWRMFLGAGWLTCPLKTLKQKTDLYDTCLSGDAVHVSCSWPARHVALLDGEAFTAFQHKSPTRACNTSKSAYILLYEVCHVHSKWSSCSSLVERRACTLGFLVYLHAALQPTY